MSSHSSVYISYQNLFRYFTGIAESGTQCNETMVPNLMGLPFMKQDSFYYSASTPLELEGIYTLDVLQSTIITILSIQVALSA